MWGGLDAVKPDASQICGGMNAIAIARETGWLRVPFVLHTRIGYKPGFLKSQLLILESLQMRPIF